MSVNNSTPENAAQPRFLTTKEVLDRLRISRSSLYEYAKQGLLSPRKLGRKNLYPVEDVETFIAKCMLPPKSNGGTPCS
ncbi:hypothetical protein CCB81_02405 [Armatimonadetes bacterium Uphvl-Ar2]|nr:hypothetical protein CCB81_02405 [Armatimonadetes bacterium Uphvl-Ar2]